MTRFPSFAHYFTALHQGKEPYDWQSRLADHLATDGHWPWHLDVPTGLGKTTAIAIAVYELARQCHEGRPRTAPQRIFHIVDRRTIIDSTAEYISDIAEQINTASTGPLHTVGQALSTLCGPGDGLIVAAGSIHGDSPDDRLWLRTAGCSIVSLTSHQFVSRLLFRAYGVRPSTRPIAAGLCGIDRLVLFDEPHLSAQSVHTILAAEGLQERAVERLGVPRAQTALLGATVGRDLVDLGKGALSLVPQRESAPAARKRLTARRDGRVLWAGAGDTSIEKLLVAKAQEAQKSGAQRIVVFANTVGMAQSIYLKLRATEREDAPVTLLTSRFRPADRIDRIEELPVTGTVVTTQTLEVGVDESFDVLITEACPWDALVQRLGRLNRDGKSVGGHATIVAGWDDVNDIPVSRKASDAIYGEDRVHAGIRLLRTLQLESGPEPVDLGYSALQTVRTRTDVDDEAIVGSPERIGTLTSAMLPIMAQTQPVPDPDIPVDSLVTGPDAKPANEVSVAWRSHLDFFDAGGDTPTIAAAEVVAVPRSSLALFLLGKTKATAETHDTIGDVLPARGILARPKDLAQCRIRGNGERKWRTPGSFHDIMTAEHLVMAPEMGGYDPVLGWTGNRAHNGENLDISIPAAMDSLRRTPDPRRPARVDLVLTKGILEAQASRYDGFDLDPLRSEFRVLEKRIQRGFTEDDLDLSILKEAAETSVKGLSDQAEEGNGLAANPFEPNMRTITVMRCNPTAVMVRIRDVHKRAAGQRQGLVAHQRQVAAWAHSDAHAVGLVPELVTEVATAGLYHDEGKLRPEFQAYLGGSPDADHTSALAKSGRQLHSSRERQLWSLAGLEPKWEHEGGSVSRVPGLSPLQRHLAGSHHGLFRPILPPVVLTDPIAAGSYPDPLAHAREFAELNRLYGVWGLAFLEAVLRLADWRASAHPLDKPVESVEVAAERSVAVPTSAEQITTAMTGLHTHPLTGWFAAIGLLAAAQHDDPQASLCWEPMQGNHDGLPVVPVLRSTVPVAELVDRIFFDPQWDEAEKLLRAHTTRGSLGVKSQKLQPASALHTLLVDADTAENALVLALCNDVVAADKDKLVMAIAPIANNASYPKIALDRISEKRRTRSADEAYDALISVVAGFSNDPCDGGMDRNPAEVPGINGLGDVMMRQSRSALAPLVIYGISRLGSGPTHGISVSNRARELVLPLPVRPRTFPELQALTFIGRGDHEWEWSSAGLQWIYAAKQTKPTQYEAVWRGGIQRRTETV